MCDSTSCVHMSDILLGPSGDGELNGDWRRDNDDRREELPAKIDLQQALSVLKSVCSAPESGER